MPKSRSGATKRRWVSFYNVESEEAMKEYLATGEDNLPKLFRISDHTFVRIWKAAYEKTGVKVTPQVLREWFCDEMGRLGVPDRYVDAFCGRAPKAVLARRYSDFSPEKLKEIYDKANLRVLD